MRKLNFNKNWQLKHGSATILESIMGTSANVEKVNLPHDALISCPRYADCVSGPGMAFFEGEDVIYSKTFFVGEEERGKVHYINFDGVYMNASVRVNQRHVTTHAYGYSPFTVRIDEYLNYGRDNTLDVRVRGYAQPNARWYPGLGIYRDVTLLTGELLHIAHDGVHVTTLDCDEELASLGIESLAKNLDYAGHEGRIHVIVKNAEGSAVAEETNRFYIGPGEQTILRARVEVERPALWDAENPNLYTCEVTLLNGTERVDSDIVTFGMRKLQLDSRRGLRVNGKTVKLRGGCIHHDNAMLGAISVPDAEMRKIALLKSGGYNAVRTAHNPPSTHLLEACDRLGMYVMDEFTDVWNEGKAAYDFGAFFEKEWERDAEDFVCRDYNHPSVILWSIGNEIPETGDVISDKWGKRLFDKFKSLDSTRPITNGINTFVSIVGCLPEVIAEMTGRKAEDAVSGGINDLMFAGDSENSDSGDMMGKFGTHPAVYTRSQEAADMLDIVGYNYTADLYEKQHEIHPNRVFFGSETNPPKLDYNWNIVMSKPYVIGDFCWTGWDYLGEVGGGRISLKTEHNGKFMADYPYICAYQADFNLIGDRRPMSYWRETVWTGREHKPYISVHNPMRYGMKFVSNAYAWTDTLPTWSWTGCEGMKTAVEIYSDAQEAELIVNGVSLGRKPVGDSFRKFYVRFETTYEPGEIVAVTYIGGEEVGRCALKTIEGGRHLCVSADKTALRAGSNDLCYIMIHLTDESGTLDMLTEKKVTARVEGATLAGMGSGDPMTEESYLSNTHKLFEGKALAIIRTAEQPGAADVTISCEGCEDVHIPLNCVCQQGNT